MGESDVPAFGPPANLSIHLAISSIIPAGSVHKSRGDSVVRMWVQLKRLYVLCVWVLQRETSHPTRFPVCCCLPTPMTLASGGVRCSRFWSTSQLIYPSGHQLHYSSGVCPQIQRRQCGAYVGAVEAIVCVMCVGVAEGHIGAGCDLVSICVNMI